MCDGLTGDDRSEPHTAGFPRKPFLRLPTACSATGLETKLTADSWQDPGNFVHASFFTHLPPPDEATQVGITGCEAVPFDPTISAQPRINWASAPTGWSFNVHLPQNDNPDGLAEADLKQAVVTLPEGVSVSPSSADGLKGCSPQEIGLVGTTFDEPNPIHFNTDDPTCPDASKIGTVRIDTPLLDTPLDGAVYLATPHDNPFGNLITIYLVVKGPGIIMKLPGKVETDPQTGQVTTTFDHNPQLPFTDLHLEFKDGPRSPLITPPTCGTYTTAAKFTSWSGKTVEQSDSFTVDRTANGGLCGPLGFSPDFLAGTKDAIAGKSTSFLLSLSRSDEDQQLKTLTVQMPKGVIGKLKGMTKCPRANARAGTCSEASRIGSVSVAAGAGTNPFWITTGRVYLTGPYRGAPFGLSIVVPAKAGPFDLGNVNVRSAVFLDPDTVTLRVVSDPIPRILDGIPLDVRAVRVTIDKPGFILNPTSCRSKHVGGTIESTEGTQANVSTHFQVAGCGDLGFSPRFAIAVGRTGHTGAGHSTPLTTTLSMPKGDANLASVKVTLPNTLNALLPVINRACTRDELAANQCKAKAGWATAATPLLDHGLRGAVYFVKRPDGGIPDLVVALRGEVSVNLTGRVKIPASGQLSTNFATVPDVPVTKFTLHLVDGRSGPIGVVGNLCKPKNRRARMHVTLKAQNGAVVDRSQRLVIHGCGGSHRRHR